MRGQEKSLNRECFSNNDAVFSLSSATGGAMIGALPSLDFYTGTVNTSVPANSSALYQMPVPPEGTRMKWTSTHAGTVQLRLEQGTVPASSETAQHYYSSGASVAFNQALSATAWPWQPNQTDYLRIVNNAATAATVTLTMNGKNALTEDEDNYRPARCVETAILRHHGLWADSGQRQGRRKPSGGMGVQPESHAARHRDADAGHRHRGPAVDPPDRHRQRAASHRRVRPQQERGTDLHRAVRQLARRGQFSVRSKHPDDHTHRRELGARDRG